MSTEPPTEYPRETLSMHIAYCGTELLSLRPHLGLLLFSSSYCVLSVEFSLDPEDFFVAVFINTGLLACLPLHMAGG